MDFIFGLLRFIDVALDINYPVLYIESVPTIAAGPASLEDYFQKGARLGQKAALQLWKCVNV